MEKNGRKVSFYKARAMVTLLADMNKNANKIN
jgi:hypothetical protein